MELHQLSKRAMEVRKRYSELSKKRMGREWNNSEIMQGFVVDVGELMELVMAKEGTRDDKEGNLDELLERELADCLWSVLVLAKKYNIDMEKSFLESMDILDKRIDKKMAGNL